MIPWGLGDGCSLPVTPGWPTGVLLSPPPKSHQTCPRAPGHPSRGLLSLCSSEQQCAHPNPMTPHLFLPAQGPGQQLWGSLPACPPPSSDAFPVLPGHPLPSRTPAGRWPCAPRLVGVEGFLLALTHSCPLRLRPRRESSSNIHLQGSLVPQTLHQDYSATVTRNLAPEWHLGRLVLVPSGSPGWATLNRCPWGDSPGLHPLEPSPLACWSLAFPEF